MSEEAFDKTKIAIFSATLFFILFVVALGTAIFFYNRYQTAQKKLNNPEVVTDEEIDSLLNKMARLIDLPPNEKPTLATVVNKEQVASQPFFANAQVGDKVLIFRDAKKGYLYRPSTNKIINVGPVIISSPTPTKSTNPTPTGEKVMVSPTKTVNQISTPAITLTPSPTQSPVVPTSAQ